MKKIEFVILLVMLGVVSCNDKNTEPSVFLTMPARVNPLLSGGDVWVYATDKTGKLLAIQQTSPDGALELKSASPVPDSITVTFFKATQGSDGTDHFLLWSFGGIPRNSSMTSPLADQSIPQPEVVGTATLTVTDSPAGSTKAMTFSDGWRMVGGKLNFAGSYYKAAINLISGHPDILVCAYVGDTPTYAWFKGVNPGDSLVKSFVEFNSLPHTVDLAWEGSVGATIAGFNDNTFFGDGYVNSYLDVFTGTQPNNVPLGYLDGFTGYKTRVTSFSEDLHNSMLYQKTGSVNTTLPFPSFDFTFTDKTLKDFSFVTSNPYEFKNSFWYQGSGDWTASWWIYSGNQTTPRFTEIPAAILTKYPNLDITKLVHQYTTLHKSLTGYSYSNYIQEWLAGHAVTVGYSMTDAEFYEYSAN